MDDWCLVRFGIFFFVGEAKDDHDDSISVSTSTCTCELWGLNSHTLGSSVSRASTGFWIDFYITGSGRAAVIIFSFRCAIESTNSEASGLHCFHLLAERMECAVDLEIHHLEGGGDGSDLAEQVKV